MPRCLFHLWHCKCMQLARTTERYRRCYLGSHLNECLPLRRRTRLQTYKTIRMGETERERQGKRELVRSKERRKRKETDSVKDLLEFCQSILLCRYGGLIECKMWCSGFWQEVCCFISCVGWLNSCRCTWITARPYFCTSIHVMNINVQQRRHPNFVHMQFIGRVALRYFVG